MQGNIYHNWFEARDWIRNCNSNGKKVVFTNGVFDLIHPGHLHYLNAARKIGDFLIIAINTDDSVRKLKGPARPVNCQQDRAEILSFMKPVDGVVFFSDDTPHKIIEYLQPQILVKGGDYALSDIAGHNFILQNGGTVYAIPFRPGYSSTAMINKINHR